MSVLYWLLSIGASRQQLPVGKCSGLPWIPHSVLFRWLLRAHGVRTDRGHAEDVQVPLPVWAWHQWTSHPAAGEDSRGPARVPDWGPPLQEDWWDIPHKILCAYDMCVLIRYSRICVCIFKENGYSKLDKVIPSWTKQTKPFHCSLSPWKFLLFLYLIRNSFGQKSYVVSSAKSRRRKNCTATQTSLVVREIYH